jgi:uncharacterized membrane protein YbhN (UPF0104 family)
MNWNMPQKQPNSGVIKRRLLGLLKVAVSAALLAYLFREAARNDSFRNLIEQPKDWTLLGVAFLVELSAVAVTIVRWYLLVRAVELPFTLREAFRLGFLGFLLNFFTVGAIGGDAIRAVFVARSNPGRGAVAVATVVVDRCFGLFALLLLVSITYFAMDWSAVETRDPAGLKIIQNLCQIALASSAAGAVVIVVLLLPGFTTSPFWDFFCQLPVVGPTITHLIEALRMYRRRIPVLAAVLGMSLAVHGLLAIGIYLIARGLPGQAPGFMEHLVISPLASAFGAIPLPGGLGAFEAALDFLYRRVSPESVAASQGFVIALGYRIITLLIATIGVGYYLASRREVQTALQEAKRQHDLGDEA